MSTAWSLLLAGTALGALTPWLVRDDAVEFADATTPAAASPTPAAASPAAEQGTLVAPTAATTPASDRSRELQLPDGSTMPTLNGATDAPSMKDYWGPFPWSPIVGTERSSAGLDWYRHADGSYSTTQMVWRSDLGRMAAMTRVAHPGPTPAAVANSPARR